MKLLNIFLVALFLTFVVACGDKKEDKKEEPVKEETQKEVEPEKKEEIAKPDMSIAEVKMLTKKWALNSFSHADGKKEDNIKNAFLNFKEDGSFEEFFGGKIIASGTWQLTEDKKMIVLVHKTGDMAMQLKDGKETLEIKEIKEDKLVTADNGGKMTENYTPAK